MAFSMGENPAIDSLILGILKKASQAIKTRGGAPLPRSNLLYSFITRCKIMNQQHAQKSSATQHPISSVSIPLLQPRAFETNPAIAEQSQQVSAPLAKHSFKQMNARSESHLPIQAKLTIGEVGDPYEQEADRVAAQVVERINSPQAQAKTALQRQSLDGNVQRSGGQEEDELQMKPSIQRQAEEEDELQMKPSIQRQEEEDELQMKPLVNSIQRQSEAEEEELQMKPSIQRQAEEEELQMKPNSLQRQEEEDELQMKSNSLQRRADLGGMAAPNNLESSINQARGSGQGLSNSIRQPMEQAFGVNFSQVRVHTDSQSDQLNRSINAQAFTTKNDIFFSKGKYSPDSKSGQELLAHELTHVVQQSGNTIQKLERQTSPSVLRKPQPPHGTIQRGFLSDPANDPLIGYDNNGLGGDKSLLYGLDANRKATKTRLKAADNARTQNGVAPPPLRTIDEYNRDAGINPWMAPEFACIGIFQIREALKDFEASGYVNWKLSPKVTSVNADLYAWVKLLAENQHQIGLYDLGDTTKEGIFGFRKRKGLKKLKSKGRFTKNVGEDKIKDLTPEDAYAWLNPNRTYDESCPLSDQLEKSNKKKKQALAEWVQKAFFRRTSKLGIDFATQRLNARINFNTAKAIDYQSSDTYLKTPQAGRIAEEAKNPTKKNRQITVSEYRHIKKQMQLGNIQPNQVNFYDEF
jgi:hypothetical protein